MLYGGIPTCPMCGRKLVGVSLFYGSKWTCSDCAKDKEEPIYCERGRKVEFANPNSGREHERKEAAELLKAGVAYEVEGVEVGSYSSKIELKEFPGKKFNSVFFRRVS